MSTRSLIATAACSLLVGIAPLTAAPADDSGLVARGRYIVTIGGCNDCHTPGFAMSNGETPESEWLIGDSLGWQGPWGTTYPPNLRISLSNMTADEWVAFARNLHSRPPMPSFTLNRMTEADLRAIYAFVRSLQPLGDPAPTYLPPGQAATTPVVTFPSPPPTE
jgi:mono/diheme cytochrome c family protein